MQREFVSWMDLIHAFQKLISMHLLSFNDTGGIPVVVTLPETNIAPANGWQRKTIVSFWGKRPSWQVLCFQVYTSILKVISVECPHHCEAFTVMATVCTLLSLPLLAVSYAKADSNRVQAVGAPGSTNTSWLENGPGLT